MVQRYIGFHIDRGDGLVGDIHETLLRLPDISEEPDRIELTILLGASYYEEKYRARVLGNLQRRAKSLGYILQDAPMLG